MRYDFIEAFSDIEDEYIAGAMPMAQKPVELRPEPRSKRLAWKRFAAAAACLAVLSAGGVIAVNAVRSGNVLSPISSETSGSSTTISGESSDSSDVIGKDVVSKLPGFDETEKPWYNDSEIYHEGITYKVTNSQNFDGVRFSVGLTQDEYGFGSLVKFCAVVENTTDETIGLYARIRTEILTCHMEDPHTLYVLPDADTQDDDFKYGHHTIIIQPGETYYQNMRFGTFGGHSVGYEPEQLYAPAGTYEGTATVLLQPDPYYLDDRDRLTEHKLDFNVNIADWNEASEYFVNEGDYVFKKDFYFYDISGEKFRFKYTTGGIYLYEGEDYRVGLYGGRFVHDYYLTDLNGDGSCEIVSTVSIGSDPVHCNIYAYDLVNKTRYYLRGEPDKYDYRVSRENGRLMAAKTLPVNADAVISREPLTLDMMKTGTPIMADIGEIPKANGVTKIFGWESYNETVPNNASYSFIPGSKKIFGIGDAFDGDALRYEAVRFVPEEFRGDEFGFTGGKVYVKPGASETEQVLYAAPEIINLYLADLNGDGKREIISECWNGLSGLSAGFIMVYDYANSKLYCSPYSYENIYSSYSLEVKDGVLFMTEYSNGGHADENSSKPLTLDILISRELSTINSVY